MRTTIDLSEEAYQLAKAVARERNQSLGKVVSEFIIAAAEAPTPGIYIPDDPNALPVVRIGRRITSEEIKALDDEW